MKNKQHKSPPIFTEPTEANLIEGLYNGQSLTEMLAPMHKRVVEAPAMAIYNAWLNSDGHAQMTGAEAVRS